MTKRDARRGAPRAQPTPAKPISGAGKPNVASERSHQPRCESTKPRIAASLAQPLGVAGTVLLIAAVCVLPAWLFADPLWNYYIYGDDWEFVASSRTPWRALENLWTPHNVHVVPVWRIWTAAVVAVAGSLQSLPPLLALASYALLVATMLLAGLFVWRETGRPALAVTTMVFLGTTSLMQPAASWFSASQATGAGFGVLLALLFAQGWRRKGGAWRLVMIVICAWMAGGCWTTGHVAGLVVAAYLLADARRKCFYAALVPLLSAVIGVVVVLGSGGRGIEQQSTISFHGRSTKEAISPVQGALHTVQAIPERLVLGDLGLGAKTTFPQAVALIFCLGLIWVCSRRRQDPLLDRTEYALLLESEPTAHAKVPRWVATPLESVGAVLIVCSYGMLWTFRGYLPFSSLRGFVPWYETIPQIGLALFVSGWWSAAREPTTKAASTALTRAQALAILLFQCALIAVHVPQSRELFGDPLRIGGMNEEEKKIFPIAELKRLRNVYLWSERAERQHRQLARLDHAQNVARRMGVGRDQLVQIFGRHIWPDPPVIDDANLLDLPWRGTPIDPEKIQNALGDAFAVDPIPIAPWLHSDSRNQRPAKVSGR
jgi:hypothetical protein